MGTDIHPALEVNLYGDKWSLAMLPPALPSDRDYVSFAILADVRNGFGFAGVPTHEKLTPISAARSFPADISIELARLMVGNEYLLGDHSYSYVTLAELEAYDLDRKFLQVGVMDAANAALVDAGKSPREWCGSTTAPGFVSREWYSTLRDQTWLLVKMIEVGNELFEKHSCDWNRSRFTKDCVRFVFGFDS